MDFRNIASALAAMAALCVSQAYASVEGEDGRSYVIGEVEITSAQLRPEEITVASVNAAEGCDVYKGIASIYGLNQGSGDSSTQPVAGGGRLNVKALTAAMKPPVPMHATAYVINKRNGKMVAVKINDRGPYVKGRIIDLTPAAGSRIGINNSIAPVEVKVCRKALASAE